MPLANLCSRLVVMSTRGISRHSNAGLAPSRPPPPAPCFPRSLAQALPTRRLRQQRRFAVAGSLDLEQQRTGSCVAGGDVTASPQPGPLRRPHPWGSLRATRFSFFGLHVSDSSFSRRSLSHRSPRSSKLELVSRRQNPFFLASLQLHQVPRTRSAFHHQDLTCPPLAETRFALARLHRRPNLAVGPPTQRPVRRFPTCVRSRPSSLARPRPLPAIRRNTRATCRPMTSAVKMIHEHTKEPPRPHHLARRQAVAPMGSSPLAELAYRVSPGQGSPCRLLTDPHCDDRSPLWIYPNLIDSDTSCREILPRRAWKRRHVATVR